MAVSDLFGFIHLGTPVCLSGRDGNGGIVFGQYKATEARQDSLSSQLLCIKMWADSKMFGDKRWVF